MNRQRDLEPHNISEAALLPDAETAISIEHLRTALNARAEYESGRPAGADWLAPARQRRRSAQRRVVLAWSCAAALCFAVVPLSTHRAGPPSQPQVASSPQTAPTAVDDTALLEQIDTAITEPVPSSLAPLTELDSWNSTTSTASSLDRTENKNVTQ